MGIGVMMLTASIPVAASHTKHLSLVFGNDSRVGENSKLKPETTRAPSQWLTKPDSEPDTLANDSQKPTLRGCC